MQKKQKLMVFSEHSVYAVFLDRDYDTAQGNWQCNPSLERLDFLSETEK